MWLLGYPIGPWLYAQMQEIRDVGHPFISSTALETMGRVIRDRNAECTQVSPDWLRLEAILRHTFGRSTRKGGPIWQPPLRSGSWEVAGYPPDDFGEAYKERFHCLLHHILEEYEDNNLPSFDVCDVEESQEERLEKALHYAIEAMTKVWYMAKSCKMQETWCYFDASEGVYRYRNRQ